MTDGSIVARLTTLASGIRFGQFLSVGVLGYLVDNAVLAGLIELFGVSVVLGKPVSAETAIIVMFIANERWTFAKWGESDLASIGRRFVKSNVVRWGGAGVAYAVLLVLSGHFGMHYFLANTIGIGVGFMVNYLAESLFTWRVGID
ncbi:MAG: GtrA family protein [Halobacteriales archaeon]|nr:GtrA family protein [Halobacteriales archaeon]